MDNLVVVETNKSISAVQFFEEMTRPSGGRTYCIFLVREEVILLPK